VRNRIHISKRFQFQTIKHKSESIKASVPLKLFFISLDTSAQSFVFRF